MAALLSHTSQRDALSSSTPSSRKGGVFSSGGASRRASSSNVSANSNWTGTSSTQIPQGIGYSPGAVSQSSIGQNHFIDAKNNGGNNNNTNNTNSPAGSGSGSGIPSFRHLRSLLPFGAGKNSNAIASTSSPSHNHNTPNHSSSASTSTSRSPFSHFGSVRRSMNRERDRDRERKTSLSNEATPVISIDPVADDAAIRRSVSLSRLGLGSEKPLPRQPEDYGGEGTSNSNPFRVESAMTTSDLRFSLRTPSPGPPLSAELSTIIEADSSGVSKHFPATPFVTHSSSSSSASAFNSPHSIKTTQPRGQSTLSKAASKAHSHSQSQSHFTSNFNNGKSDSELESDTSMLELPTTSLHEQVREAMRKSTGSSSPSVSQWRPEDSNEPLVIDADDHPDLVADASFLNLDGIDEGLLGLLSPHSAVSKSKDAHSATKLGLKETHSRASNSPTTPTFPPSPASTSRRNPSSFLPRLRSSHSPSSTPSSPHFNNTIPTPSPTRSSHSVTTPRATPLASTSSRPPAIGISISGNSWGSAPASPSSPGPGMGFGVAVGSTNTVTSTPARRNPNPPSQAQMQGGRSMSISTRLFSPPAASITRTPSNLNHNHNQNQAEGSRAPVTRTLRQIMLGNRSNDGSNNSGGAETFSTPPTGRASLDSRRPQLSRSEVGSSRASDIGLGRPSRGSLDVPRMRQQQSLQQPMQSQLQTSTPVCSSSLEPGRGRAYKHDFEASEDLEHEIDGRYRADVGGPERAGRVREWDRDKERVVDIDRDREKQRTSSLRVTDTSANTTTTPDFRIQQQAFVAARERKRSMSVQERVFVPSPQFGSAMGAAAGIARPGSSAGVHASGLRGARGSERGTESEAGGSTHGGYEGGGTPGPRTEWLGPRTAKAFRAAGLLDFDRDREREGHSRDRDRDGSGGLPGPAMRLRSGSLGGGGMPSPSPAGGSGAAGGVILGQNRFATMRSASEYNPSSSSNYGSAHGAPAYGRAPSRMAYSEVGGMTSGGHGHGHGHGARRGSGSFSVYGGSVSVHGGGSASAHGGSGSSPYGHAGLMESPTFTMSSSSRGERDTPKSSTSTEPTSLAESFGYLGSRVEIRDRERDRDREREREREEEIRELKDRHATEMGALLGALSDSQRTARMLREENAQLRERLDRLSGIGRENEGLRQACENLEGDVVELRRECEGLRDELTILSSARTPNRTVTTGWDGRQSAASSGGLRTPVAKPGNRSPLAVDTTPQFLRQSEDTIEGEATYDGTVIIHEDADVDDEERFGAYDQTGLSEAHDEVASPPTHSLRRRTSDTSSIFPIPPANMTMLLHDDGTSGGAGNSNRSSADHDDSTFHFPLPLLPGQSASRPIPLSSSRHNRGSSSASQSPPMTTYHNFAGPGHYANKSIASNTSISPTTANFSMTTGSPGSGVFLRPEHEILLGDMESLDLGPGDLDVGSASPSIMDRMASRDGW